MVLVTYALPCIKSRKFEKAGTLLSMIASDHPVDMPSSKSSERITRSVSLLGQLPAKLGAKLDMVSLLFVTERLGANVESRSTIDPKDGDVETSERPIVPPTDGPLLINLVDVSEGSTLAISDGAKLACWALADGPILVEGLGCELSAGEQMMGTTLGTNMKGATEGLKLPEEVCTRMDGSALGSAGMLVGRLLTDNVIEIDGPKLSI